MQKLRPIGRRAVIYALLPKFVHHATVKNRNSGLTRGAVCIAQMGTAIKFQDVN
jgi:hypothetical protein